MIAVPAAAMPPSRKASATKARVSSALRASSEISASSSSASGLDERAPVVARSSLTDGVDEGEDQVALVAQRRAGVDGALDVHQRGHLDVGAVAPGLAPLHDEHQDVVDVDLDLLDELDLEDDVVEDRLLLCALLPRYSATGWVDAR